MCTQYVGFDYVNRVVDNQVHPHGRRQVKDDVGLADQSVHHNLVCNGVDDKREPVRATQVLDVVQAPGGHVVDRGDPVATSQQDFGEVGSDEAGATGDECAAAPVNRIARMRAGDSHSFTTLFWSAASAPVAFRVSITKLLASSICSQSYEE